MRTNVIPGLTRNPELTPVALKYGHRIKSGVTTLKFSSRAQVT